MKYKYQRPQLKVANIEGEEVMISTSVPEDKSAKKVDVSDIGAKRNTFDDSPSFFSSDEEE